MSTPRRVYIYVLSAISLQAVTWALIALLRNLLISKLQPNASALAFQIAVLVIGLPVFLAHWLWGQRLAHRDRDEQTAVLRRVYLYGMQTAYLVPVVDSTLAIIGILLSASSGRNPRYLYPPLSTTESVFYYLLALVVLIPFWLYQNRINAEDSKAVPEAGSAATVRRLYVLGFSAAGLIMATVASIDLVEWLLRQIARSQALGRGSGSIPLYDVAKLIVGIPLWIVFWRWSQNLFAGPNEEERESSLRKFYLYFAVFGAALTAVTSAAFILEGLFKRVLDVASRPGLSGDIREPLSIITCTVVLWTYHAYVIREDAELASEAPRQAGVRRLYTYLIAAIGLSACLVGLVGDVNVMIQSLDQASIGASLRSQLASSTAALVAGLPVWLIPWRSAQSKSAARGDEGLGERRSIVRKIYLYFFLLVAMLTILGNIVYIVFRILSAALGDPAPAISELGQAIALCLIAIAVMLFHGWTLRGDGQRARDDQISRLEGFRIAAVNPGKSSVMHAIVEQLERRIPGIAIASLDLPLPEDEASRAEAQDTMAAELGQAGLIIGPWTIAVGGGAHGAVPPVIAQAVVESPARKLLFPTRPDGWEWAGLEPWTTESLVRQTVHAARQILEGERVKPARSLGIGAILGIIFAALILLSLLSIPLIPLFLNLG